jgi:alpha-beta hydrolase superfamily lysophospholipase
MEYRAPVLTPFTASDGENIAVHDWPLPPDAAVRGVIVLVHGLGEHAGRHAPLAAQLNRWAFAVRAYDQYGHGESGGQRGGLPSPLRLLEDLADVIESTRVRLGPQRPIIVLGHSLGGLVAANLAARGCAPIEGLVLSSPALGARVSGFQKFLLSTLPRFAPNLAVSNGVDPDALAHDPAVAAAYRADRLVHDRITPRLALFFMEAGAQVIAKAPQWKVPTLLLYAGDDRLVDPAASRAFAQAAPPDVVTARCFDTLYHEIFNEPDPGPLEALRQWLDARF